MHIQGLEDRKLFAASASMVHGVVAIRGSSGADHVDVSTWLEMHKSAHRVKRQDLTVQIGDHSFVFDASKVRGIVARLGAGDDTININALSRYAVVAGNLRAVPSNLSLEVNGDAGSDLISTAMWSATLHGGDGNDTIGGADAVYGDGGDDLIVVNGGSSRIDAGAGNDDIIVCYDENTQLSGHHRKIYGGDGDDRLFTEPYISRVGKTNSISKRIAAGDYDTIRHTIPRGLKPYSLNN